MPPREKNLWENVHLIMDVDLLDLNLRRKKLTHTRHVQLIYTQTSVYNIDKWQK